MVLRAVERGEVEPVVLDLRPVGDVEADRAPDRLDPLPGAHHRMDAAAAAAARRQRDVERVLGEPRRELRVGEPGAACLQPASSFCLAVLNARPAALRFSAGSEPSVFWKAESSPRKRAFSFSRDAASPAALNAASARDTRLSRSDNGLRRFV